MTGTHYRYLLDTNIVSDMVRRPTGRAAHFLARINQQQVCTSIVVACEIRFGVIRKGSAKLTSQVETVLSGLPILPFKTPAEWHYGEVRAQLESQGQPIGYNNLFIAAHALAMGLILVTDNVDEFSRVTGLEIENWLDSQTTHG